MRDLGRSIVDPFPSAIDHGGANLIQPDMSVVISTNGHQWCHFAKRANQITEPTQFRGPIDQVSSKKNHIRFRRPSGFEDLSAQSFRTRLPKMNIAHIHQTTRIVPQRQAFFTKVERLLVPDFQQSGRQFGSPLEWISSQRVTADCDALRTL